MRLHRNSGKPDWIRIPPSSRNRWQRLAAATHGIVTPGNVFSIIGLVLVIAGLILLAQREFVAGVILVAIGRLADLADGQSADKTGTKSPLGEIVDASFDKIGAILAIIVFAVCGLAPVLIMAVIAVQNISNIMYSYIARRRKVPLHPSAAGKISTAGQWLVFLLFIVAAANGGIWPAVAYSIAGMAIGLGLYASVGYARAALGPVRQSRPRP
jgi:cardiolipin synthase